MSRFATVTLIVSIAGHGLFLGLGAPRKRVVLPKIERGAAPIVLAATDALERKHRARVLRRELVERARANRAKGTLLLGRFLLEANRIDADEEGQSFDDDEALARYEKRLVELREALRADLFIAYAASTVFGDLRYHGRPGGRMGDALLDGGGSCEQIAQLVVAAAYDVGRGKEVSFRAYGRPGSDGAGHLAPIGKYEGREYDLMTGNPAAPGGARVVPEEIIEVYARVHGLAPPLESPKKMARRRAIMEARNGEPGRTSLASGFPPNDDRFPGSLPLYAARAVKPPMMGVLPEEMEDLTSPIERAQDCAYFMRMAYLNPPEIHVQPDLALGMVGTSFEPVRTPNPPRLEREAMLLRAAEDLASSRRADEADRLMSWACLAAVGDVASVDFALASEYRLSALALDAAKRARERGKEMLLGIPWSTPYGVEIMNRLRTGFAGRYWLLLFLEGGGDVVLELTRRGEIDDWGRISSMAALLLFSDTRIRSLEVVGGFPLRDQVDVMHEVFHAHDHLRPWASNVDFEVSGKVSARAGAFIQAYRVFRGLALRLWEGQLDPGETIDAFLREARDAGLDAGWQAAMIDYYARNVLGLYSQRAKGVEVVVALRKVVNANGHSSLEPLRKQLAYIEAEGRLDARTLADAFRQR